MNSMNIQDILECLPHRYPFLLVDKVLDFTAYESLVAIKNVSFNENFFAGHFPGRAVMPGVLIVEALAQASGILAYKSTGWDSKESLFFFGGIEKARFKRVVVPGDVLELKVRVLKRRTTIWKFQGEAWVNDELACSVEMTSAEGKYSDS
ncbi:MAG: 3-hydroxyacyl-[acyl-carrier-protein] dehydratase FabZ [Legionellales bacterium]|nr:MAG: 3-hydroxyacyl-[acyl-carrier-protein] dehydratase FabZ [Legionellales bacterium]